MWITRWWKGQTRQPSSRLVVLTSDHGVMWWASVRCGGRSSIAAMRLVRWLLVGEGAAAVASGHGPALGPVEGPFLLTHIEGPVERVLGAGPERGTVISIAIFAVIGPSLVLLQVWL